MKKIDIFNKFSSVIFNNIKVYLLRFKLQEIFDHFRIKLSGEINKYARNLPSHVVSSEIEDLRVVAQLELIESFKVWNKSINPDLWPLARRRISGAMKDHIRFITRTDPSRVYDWVAEATYIHEIVESSKTFAHKIENEMQLNDIMEILSLREKRVVDAYIRLELNFKEIGSLLSVSESQASRIYKQSILKMQKAIKKDH